MITTLQVAVEGRSLSSNGLSDAFPAESQQERRVYLADDSRTEGRITRSI
jgi:hypothetical protein